MENLTPEKDTVLWKKAKKRANFKKHFFTYIVINIFLWIIWALKPGSEHDYFLPWPAWVTLGWGLGVALAYYEAYFGSSTDIVEKEYDKLLKDKEKRGNN